MTITGVDDAVEDGDVDYTIIIRPGRRFRSARYAGRNADDVMVTNEDDDGLPIGGSDNDSSTDTPLPIPDVNDVLNFIASDIVIEDVVTGAPGAAISFNYNFDMGSSYSTNTIIPVYQSHFHLILQLALIFPRQRNATTKLPQSQAFRPLARQQRFKIFGASDVSLSSRPA